MIFGLSVKKKVEIFKNGILATTITDAKATSTTGTRIEISTLSEQYFAKDIEFTEVNSEMVINNTDIVSTNGNAVLEPAANTLIFDKNGNMGIVISQDDNGPEDLDDTVTILVLTKNFTAKQIMDLLTIKRYYYD